MIAYHLDGLVEIATLGESQVGIVRIDGRKIWTWRMLGCRNGYETTERKAKRALESAFSKWLAGAGLERVKR